MAKFEYAPAPESRAVVTIRPSYGLFIGGEFVQSADGSMFKTISPSSEEVLAEVTEAGEADIDRAVLAARKAFDGSWGRLSGAGRGKYLFRIARILQERARTAEVASWLASHQDVNAIDLAGAAGAEDLAWADLERAGAENLKRVLRPAGEGADAAEPVWSRAPDLSRVKAYLETKTVWHPRVTKGS